MRDSLFIFKLGPRACVTIYVGRVSISVLFPFVQGPLFSVLEHCLLLIGGRSVEVTNHLVSFTLTRGAGIIGVPVTVKCSSLKLKLKRVDVSILHKSSQGVLLCCLLLGFKRILRSDNWGKELVILGVVFHFLCCGVKVSSLIQRGVQGDAGGGHHGVGEQ